MQLTFSNADNWIDGSLFDLISVIVWGFSFVFYTLGVVYNVSLKKMSANCPPPPPHEKIPQTPIQPDLTIIQSFVHSCSLSLIKVG